MSEEQKDKLERLRLILGVVVFLAMVGIYSFIKPLPEWMFVIPGILIGGQGVIDKWLKK